MQGQMGLVGRFTVLKAGLLFTILRYPGMNGFGCYVWGELLLDLRFNRICVILFSEGSIRRARSLENYTSV